MRKITASMSREKRKSHNLLESTCLADAEIPHLSIVAGVKAVILHFLIWCPVHLFTKLLTPELTCIKASNVSPNAFTTADLRDPVRVDDVLLCGEISKC